MNYKEYINLGFKRTDISDEVFFNETGHQEFYLTKVINDKIMISMYGSELDKPKLYIKKRHGDKNHIILLTDEMVKDILT